MSIFSLIAQTSPHIPGKAPATPRATEPPSLPAHRPPTPRELLPPLPNTTSAQRNPSRPSLRPQPPPVPQSAFDVRVSTLFAQPPHLPARKLQHTALSICRYARVS